MRTGYHYTSYENWKKIKKEGFIPYVINKTELLNFNFKELPFGIWLWKRHLSKEAHTGVVLSQIANKNASKVVLLKVKYDKDDILTDPMNDMVNFILCHSGTVGNFVFKSGKAVVVTKPIPAFNIQLLETFSWKDGWKTKRNSYGK